MTKVLKRISAVAMAAAMATTMAITASAYDSDIVSSEEASYATTRELTYGKEDTQVILYPGETIIGDTIIGEAIVSDPNLSGVSTLSATEDCPNYATSTETLQLWYNGYIQFRASYLTKEGDGSGLVAGRHVKQAWLDYRRNDKTVIGGTKYTEVASSKYDDTIYSQSASCMDDLFDWSESGRTYFWRGWFYFT